MLGNLCKIINRDSGNFDLNRIIYSYRYVTFLVISLFFLLDQSVRSTEKKLVIIICIGVSCLLVNYLYVKCAGDKRKILLLLIMETLFNAYILFPSGGLTSPVIWYSLNTILIAAIALDKVIYCWINLFIYLMGSIWVFPILKKPEISFVEILSEEANFILSLILITGVVQILSGYGKSIQEKNLHLQAVNHKVVLANSKIRESMNYIMGLYRAVHLFTTQRDEINLRRLLLDYAKKMTNLKTVFFIKNNKLYTLPEKSEELVEMVLDSAQCEAIRNMNEAKPWMIINYMEKRYILVPVKGHCKLYGIIGAELINLQIEEKDVADQLKFLSELGTLVLEKFELESLNRRLLINEEQNRIANEIHDGVLQNLFSISCGVNSLMKRTGTISKSNLSAELALLRSSINSAMSDLRSTIYGYSWNKSGSNSFAKDIDTYIETVKRFHGINIQFEVKGSHERLSPDQKKSIYRIISEATGNSIKHGKAEAIVIQLDIGTPDTTLSISDNGSGFDMGILGEEKKLGLGMRNIRFLAHSLDGIININSELNKGTFICICFPTEQKSFTFREEVV